MKNEDSFSFTYSASEQTEIEKIRNKYIQKSEDLDKMEQLRRLDKSAEKPGKIAAISVGTVGMLLFGLGMCCSLVWEENFFVTGVIMGIIGIVGIICALPLYNRITKKNRERIAPEILKLADELSKK